MIMRTFQNNDICYIELNYLLGSIFVFKRFYILILGIARTCPKNCLNVKFCSYLDIFIHGNRWIVEIIYKK